MNKRGYLILVLFVLFSVSVSAYNYGGFSSASFTGYDLMGTYYQYSQIIDFVIFFVIFFGLAQSVFGEQFSGRSGNAMQLAFAILLAGGLVMWEQRTGFILLEQLGPWIVLLLVVLFAVGLYKALNSVTGGGILPVSIAYLLFVFLLNNIASYYDVGIFDFLYSFPLFNFKTSFPIAWIRCVFPSPTPP